MEQATLTKTLVSAGPIRLCTLGDDQMIETGLARPPLRTNAHNSTLSWRASVGTSRRPIRYQRLDREAVDLVNDDLGKYVETSYSFSSLKLVTQSDQLRVRQLGSDPIEVHPA